MSESKPAKLPGLPAVSTGNPSLDRWIQSATERFEVREGARGSDLERVVTQRDLQAANFIQGRNNGGGGSGRPGGVLIQGSDGNYFSMSVDAFGDEIRKTKLFQHLMTRLDDPSRFDGLPEKVRNMLLVDLANEAAQLGAQISEIDYKFQSATESLAYRVETITASVADAQAGVRQTAFASATKDRATAGLITQIVASLGNYYQDGKPGRVNIETTLVAVADRVTGLSAEYMVKLNAGRAVAGFGLSASEDPSGATTSAFIVQADRFALIGTTTFAQAATPMATAIGQTWYNTTTKLYYRATATGSASWALYTPVVPFGVDTVTNTTFINGQVRISAGGPTIAETVGRYTVFQYAVNTSLTVAPTTGWSNTTLTPAAAEYLWMRSGTVTPPATVPSTWEAGYRVTGNQGATGTTGSTGGTGANGAEGLRGSVTRYTTSYWDGASTSFSTLFPGGWFVIGDTLTSSWPPGVTRYWNGSGWVNPGVIIDGNLLVTGSVAADKVNANGLRVGSGGLVQASGYPGFALNGVAPSPAGAGLSGARFGINDSGYAHTDTLVNWGQVFTATLGAQAYVTSPVVFAYNTASGAGMQAKSATGYGILLEGNGTRAPLKLEPLGSLPSDASPGQLCCVAGVLYFANGSVWKTVTLT